MADIRFATEADVPDVVRMGRNMWAESKTHQHSSYSDAKAERLARACTGTPLTGPPSDKCLLIACVEGVVVGMLGGYCTEDFFGHDKIAGDFVFYVSPEKRGGTLGVRLLKAFEAWATQAGARWMRPGVSTGNEVDRIVGLYEHLGYSVIGVQLMKEVQHV